MCGIAGIIKFPNAHSASRPNLAPLDAISQALAHRGPDGHGTYIDPRPNRTAILLHRRLAIIDQPTGIQPMPNEDASVYVVFNGEIYNHVQLRRELQSPAGGGHTFRSDHSDTEVLVHGWEQWGTDLPSKLQGMFAFAIWDTRGGNDTLFLARDRLGQKPLYYASLEDGIVFASTIPALLAWPEVPRRVPREQIALYLQLGYFPPPFTIFRDISQLHPAHWLRLRKDTLDGNRYWSPIPAQKLETRNPKLETSALLRSHLTNAVQSQLIADTPIACFLSGGIDSSIIALLMQNAARTKNAPPIHTVSVGFGESTFDETSHAAAVAAHIGSHHTRLQVDASQNIIETLQLLLRSSLGQPFADSSILPTYHLSKAVRQIAPVALAGDGGDELFAGYDRYRAMRILCRLPSAPILARLIPSSPLALPFATLSKKERYRRLTAAARESSPPDRYTRLTEITPPDLLSELLAESSDYVPPELSTFHAPHSPFRTAMFRDQLEYLPGDLLTKVDSASMAEALEVRAPFLDHSLVEFANALPDDQLLHGKTSKYILRQTFAPDLPPNILARPKKGFAAPFGTWFNTSLRAPLHDLLLASNSFTTTHLHKPAIERLLAEHHTGTRDHTHRLFALLMLELWARHANPDIE